MTERTFDTLNKDLQLEYKGFGKYDRKMVGGDFVRVKNLDSLSSGITVAVMTAFGELCNNPTYANFGNRAWELVSANKTLLALTEIREFTKNTLESMRRIKSVDYLTVEENPNNPEEVFITFKGTSIDDQTYKGGFELCQI